MIFKNAGLWRKLVALLASIMIISIFAVMTLNEYDYIINSELGIQTSGIINGDSDEDTEYFKSDFGAVTKENIIKLESAAYAQTVIEAEEGAVLLKNKNNALPLAAAERNVTLFGHAVVDTLWRISGAGTAEYMRKTNRVDLDEAFTTAGFEINQTLLNAYKKPTEGGSATVLSREKGSAVKGEEPSSFYTETLKNSWANYKQVAVVMLTREGGEGFDLKVSEVDDDGGTISSLALTKREKDLFKMIKAAGFDKTIVLINTNQQMELGWLNEDEYGVDACLWIGSPGLTGFTGIVNIIKGDVNPSGRLVDTFAANSLSSPAIVNACGNTPQWENISELREGGIVKDRDLEVSYVSVQIENIYVGYKYYETRYADCIMGTGNADSNAGASYGSSSWNYADEMCYPFGFGLSYTTFDQTIETVTENTDGTYTVSVSVKNTGTEIGKCPVQIYVNTPYDIYEKANNIEKSAILLVGFDKTGDIEPGKSTIVDVEVEEYLFASYDYTNTKGYVLTEGTYYFSVGDNAHDAVNNVLYAQNYTSGLIDHEGNAVTVPLTDKTYEWDIEFDSESYKYGENDVVVTNQFDKMDINNWAGNSVTYLTRSAWDTTFPTAPAKAKLLGTEMKTLLQGDYYQKPSDGPSMSEYVQGQTAGNKGVDNEISFLSMKDVTYDDDEKWNKFLDQFSLDDLATMTGNGGQYSAIWTNSINFPGKLAGDGCQGVGGNFDKSLTDGVNRSPCLFTSMLASGWNKKLMETRGNLMGNESLFLNQASVWTGGSNLHRTPFGGRQNEYYSEDANLTYMITAIQMPEMEKLGILVGNKHLTGNDQETHRDGLSTFYTEQSFRENALRGFEGSLRKGKCKAVMQSFNRQGVVWSSNCYELNINILRKEWGYQGLIITDATTGTKENMRSHYTTTITSGTNMYCLDGKAYGGSVIAKSIRENDDGYLLGWLRSAVRNTMYALSRSAAINGLSETSQGVNIIPAWQILSNIAMGMTIAAAVFTTTMYVISLIKARKDGKEAKK